MKKILSFVIILVHVWVSHTQAADTTIKKFPLYFSISIGASLNNLSGSKIDHSQYWNNQSGIGKVTWSGATGLVVNLNLHKQISRLGFFTTGLNYIQKQAVVDNTIWIHKDHLKTGYLSIPALVGWNAWPDTKAFDIWAQLGPSVNFAIVKKSFNEEAGMNTNSVTASINLGTGIRYALAPHVRLIIAYNYMHDLSKSNTQSLYSSASDPNHEYDYKFRSHIVAVGIEFTP